MKHRVLLLCFASVLAAAATSAEADRWWAHVTFLADDALEGRDTGSTGYRKAAAYVANEFAKSGLEPAGVDGYLQPVAFRSRRIIEDKSSLALVRDGRVEPVILGDEATFSMRIDPAPQLEAPLVFAGYGLRIPEARHDDLAGLDLRGKVVLFLSGSPAGIAGPLVSHYQSVRWSYLKEAGAVGTISIPNPRTMDIPWERSTLSRFLPSLTLADPSLDETAGQKLAVTVNPARAEKFFAGSGRTFKEILTLAAAGKPLPTFALPSAVRAAVTVVTEDIESPNVAAILRGTDPALRDEYVVLTAHLDHVGVSEPINGDRINNGAMDNAAGIATLLETAASLHEAKTGLRRSLVFLAVTGEEKGLLGSRYYANHPTVAATRIVANLNTDMYLPIIPLRSVIALGIDESDMAGDVRQAAASVGIEVVADPEPERNLFTRSDQYSFIKTGVPALSFKIGFVKNSPEDAVLDRWRATRYHAPSDDLSQPVDRQAAAGFNRFSLALVQAIANRPTRPAWNEKSFFKRFSRQDVSR
jgi:hypothetical protein